MGANIKAIRARIKSVDSTKHITKAMQLVASSKIRRANARMEESRFYRNVMLDAFSDLSAERSPYSVQRSRDLPAVYIVVAGDRGLAGGYNNNIFRSAMTQLRDKDLVLPIGKRAVEYYKSRGNTVSEEFISAENFTSSEASKAAYRIRDMYDNGEIGAVYLISTRFVSMMSQEPAITYILPLEKGKNRRKNAQKEETPQPPQSDGQAWGALTEYEPSAEAVLAAVIPEYIAGVLYTSVMEAYASEVAARRSAMDTATKNADAMLDDLNLKYNRARQGAITQEITEIVAGAGDD